MVDVDWKSGKDEEGGGEARDGGDAAGEHCGEEKPSGDNQSFEIQRNNYYRNAISPVRQFHGKRRAQSMSKYGIGDN